jgi:predicted RNase H-like nuclease
MRFIGVDLAWGERNPSGLAVLDQGGEVVAEDLATSDADVAAFVSAHDAGGAVLGLDAPLVVRNPSGRRACEDELQRRYGRVGAGPYPSSLSLLGGRVRAMELVERLPMPYQTVPRDPCRGHGWWAVEVFPHPALVELGALERALCYKKGLVAGRVAGLRALHRVLAGLEAATPPLRLSPHGRLQDELGRLDSLRGRARKGFEDLADAHVCAYVALWWWWHGRTGTLVAGDDEHGAILVPLPRGLGRERGPQPARQGPGTAGRQPPVNHMREPLP